MNPDHIYIDRPEISGALLDAVRDPGVRIVWLFGQIGQGKTVALQRLLNADHGCLAARAACSTPLGGEPTSSLKPWQPLKDAIEDLLQRRTDEKRNLKLVKNISLTVLACIPFVGDLAYGIKEIRRDLDEYKRGVRTVDFEKFEDEWSNTLISIADDEPVLLMIDDIQWADRQTIHALRRHLTDPAFLARPITLVLTCRQDELVLSGDVHAFYSQFSAAPMAVEFTLPRFTTEQIRRYVGEWFDTHTPDELLTSWLEQKTGGIPLFLRSYISYLLAEGVLDAHGTVVGSLQGFSGLPAEIKTINAWLMKSLTQDDMQLLLTASVLGYEFSLHELANLTQRPVLDIIRQLRAIGNTHGVCEKIGYRIWNGRESTVYRFTQHAIHAALYNELTPEEREDLHRMAAHYLNDLRHTVTEPTLISSIAQPLMVHAHLGRQPDLEYDSILLKARATNEQMDDDELRSRFNALSPLIGMSVSEMEEAYQKALAVSRLASSDIPGGGAVEGFLTAGDEGGAGAFTGFVADLLSRLTDRKPAAVLQRTRLYLDDLRISGEDPHPLVHLLHGIAILQSGAGRDEALKAFAQAAASTVSPTYTLMARFAEALFSPHADLPAALEHIKAAKDEVSPDRLPLGAMILAFIDMRFGPDSDQRHAIMANPSFAPLFSDNESMAADYPRTMVAMGGNLRAVGR